ncbi:MAG TPA: addiction module protein [Thermoanaerobaculia bacterium]|jgi:putative addiction module component (TIGR02574 family)|nr:addiction module protein [Thermoanaerobaculia bacterium]
MPQTLPVLPPPGFDDLTAEEKLDYVQSLWDHIAVHPEALPVPDWHRRILQDRMESHRLDRGAARPWEEVREEISEKVKQRRSPRG